MSSKSSAPKGEGNDVAVKPPVAKNEGSGASAKPIKPIMSKVGGGGGSGRFFKPTLPNGMVYKLAAGLVLGVALWEMCYSCYSHEVAKKMLNQMKDKTVDSNDKTEEMANNLKNSVEDMTKKVKEVADENK